MIFVAFNDSMLAVLARKMKEVHFSIIMFWFSAIGIVLVVCILLFTAFVRKEVPTIFTYNSDQMYNLIMTGVFSALNLTCLTIAYQNDKSATVSLLAYIALVYAFLADIVLFKHQFVILELLGAAIITFFNIFTIWFKIGLAPEQRGGSYETDLETEGDEDRQSSTDYDQNDTDELKTLL